MNRHCSHTITYFSWRGEVHFSRRHRALNIVTLLIWFIHQRNCWNRSKSICSPESAGNQYRTIKGNSSAHGCWCLLSRINKKWEYWIRKLPQRRLLKATLMILLTELLSTWTFMLMGATMKQQTKKFQFAYCGLRNRKWKPVMCQSSLPTPTYVTTCHVRISFWAPKSNLLKQHKHQLMSFK